MKKSEIIKQKPIKKHYEICEKCEEFMRGEECDSLGDEICLINCALEENKELKARNKYLEKELHEIKLERSYRTTNLSIGNRTEMGG